MSSLSRNIRVKYFFTVVLSLLIFVVSASDALAIEYGGFGGRPAYPREDNTSTESIFIHVLNPGDVKPEGVLTVNNSTEPKTLLVYAVDSTPSTGGAFACEQMAETKDDVGAWISLKKGEITLDPGKNELIPFTITVPRTASVGEHNGCIIIQEKLTKPDEKSGVGLSFRTGLRVAITIPGELERKLEIIDFNLQRKEDGNFLLQPKVKNLGNVSVDADVQVLTKYFFGLTHLKQGGQYPILRGDTSDWNFELKKPFWGGWYRSNFVIAYDANPEASVGVKSGKELARLQGSPVWFWSTPKPVAMIIEIIILLLIVSGALFLRKIRKNKRWIKNNWVNYEIMPGDDIKSLATRFGLSWKLLIKVNKLKAPYILTVGNIIKVPPGKQS